MKHCRVHANFLSRLVHHNNQQCKVRRTAMQRKPRGDADALFKATPTRNCSLQCHQLIFLLSVQDSRCGLRGDIIMSLFHKVPSSLWWCWFPFSPADTHLHGETLRDVFSWCATMGHPTKFLSGMHWGVGSRKTPLFWWCLEINFFFSVFEIARKDFFPVLSCCLKHFLQLTLATEYFQFLADDRKKTETYSMSRSFFLFWTQKAKTFTALFPLISVGGDANWGWLLHVPWFMSGEGGCLVTKEKLPLTFFWRAGKAWNLAPFTGPNNRFSDLDTLWLKSWITACRVPDPVEGHKKGGNWNQNLRKRWKCG